MNRMETGAFRILSILLILFILSNSSRSFLGDPNAGCRHLHDTGSFHGFSFVVPALLVAVSAGAANLPGCLQGPFCNNDL